MDNLLLMKITDCIKQLQHYPVRILFLFEKVGVMFDELIQRLTINIVHQDAVSGLGYVANNMGMFELVA